MAALALYHRIYTHASSAWQPGGGRFERVERDASDVLPEQARKELDDLLTKLEPEGAATAWAMRCLAGDRGSYACVVVAYRGFEDTQGRNGVLNHARVVRLDAAEPWFNPVPLIDEARAFPIDEVLAVPPEERLRTYLDLLSDDDSLVVPPLIVAALDDLAPELLHDVLVAALVTLGNRGATRVEIASASLEELALAAASLPVGLQRRSSWAYDAVNSAPVDVIWSASSGVPAATLGSPAVERCVTSYVNLLLDQTFNPKPLMSEDGMRDAAGLQRFLQKAAVAGDSVMSTKSRKKPAEGRDEEELLASLDRQQQAIYHSLRAYIDKRLAAYDVARQESRVAAQPQGVPLWATIAIAAGLTALLILGGQWLWNKRAADEPAPLVREERVVRAGTPAGTTEEPAPAKPSPEREAVRTLIANAESRGQWAEAVAALSVQQPALLAAMIDRAANGQDVAESVRDQLVGLSRRVKGNGPALDAAARGVLRPLLFEYVVENENGIPAVDGKLGDIDAALLKKAKDRWGVKSGRADVNDRELHSELILRWLEGNLP